MASSVFYIGMDLGGTSFNVLRAATAIFDEQG